MTTKLPLPIAGLVRRARNAKSPKDRHDYAFSGWEASIRLGVASHPPADLSALVLPSIGHWAAAFSPLTPKLTSRAVCELRSAIVESLKDSTGQTPTTVKTRQLIDLLPTYRNKVMAHASPRVRSHYERFAPLFLDSLLEAWDACLFLPAGTRMVAVESVEKAADASFRARVLDLTGFCSLADEEPLRLEASGQLEPGRVYLRDGDRATSLHPWVLYQGEDGRDRVLFFNGRSRGAEYLDFDTGELLRGRKLRQAVPTMADDAEIFVQAPPSKLTPAPPDANTIGDYELLHKLGEGGMGTVYLARQQSLGRLVALKVLSVPLEDDAVAVARFEREIAALARCDHPNVVKILASGESAGRRYYAMEYIEGADLASVRDRLGRGVRLEDAVLSGTPSVREPKSSPSAGAQRRIDPSRSSSGSNRSAWDRSLSIAFRDAALAVAHLHEMGVLHRDIKPSNLMLTSYECRIVLMDLGLAAVSDASRALTRETSGVLGTLRYMPPEQLTRTCTVDQRSDVYSLGATFYEVFCGRPIFDGETDAQLTQQVLLDYPEHAARANPALSRDLCAIVMKCIEKDPKRRYQTAAELARDLEATLADRPITARSRSLPYVVRLALMRNRLLVAVAATAVLAASAGSVAVWGTRSWLSAPVTAAALSVRDRGDGWEWSNECWRRLEASELAAAEAACKEGLRISTGSSRPALLYNLGLIAEKRSELKNARSYYKQSLALRPALSPEAALFRAAGTPDAKQVDGWDRTTGAVMNKEYPCPRGFPPGVDASSFVRIPKGTPVVLRESAAVLQGGIHRPWYRVEALLEGGLESAWCNADDLRPQR